MFKMTTVLIIIFIAVLTSAENDHRSRRYVGGEEASTAQFPYLVSLRRVTTNKHFCGGSIIHEQYILTAAHCLFIKDRKDFYIVAGTNFLNSWRKRYWVDKFSIHSHYNPDEYINDVALIKLKKSFKFSKYIQKIDLPTQEITPSIDKYPPVGVTMTISGFGRTSYYLDNSDTVQYANVTLISTKQCRKPMRTLIKSYPITHKHLCSLDEQKGFCKGDSGGPLVYDGEQVGIVSWMVRPCARGYPDVYVKVASYVNWIENTMKMFTKNLTELETTTEDLDQLETTIDFSSEILKNSLEETTSDYSTEVLETSTVYPTEITKSDNLTEVIKTTTKPQYDVSGVWYEIVLITTVPPNDD